MNVFKIQLRLFSILSDLKSFVSCYNYYDKSTMQLVNLSKTHFTSLKVSEL